MDRDHGELNYYLTQFVIGHGYFNIYLARMQKVESATCPYKDSAEDDALRTFFEWEKWKEAR